MKESMALSQYNHIQKFDEARELLSHLQRVNPSSTAVESQKKVVFSEYYGSTRHISRVNGELKIEVDHEIVKILNSKA